MFSADSRNHKAQSLAVSFLFLFLFCSSWNGGIRRETLITPHPIHNGSSGFSFRRRSWESSRRIRSFEIRSRRNRIDCEQCFYKTTLQPVCLLRLTKMFARNWDLSSLKQITSYHNERHFMPSLILVIVPVATKEAVKTHLDGRHKPRGVLRLPDPHRYGLASKSSLRNSFCRPSGIQCGYHFAHLPAGSLLRQNFIVMYTYW